MGELGLVLVTVVFFIFMLTIAMGVPLYHFGKADREKWANSQ